MNIHIHVYSLLLLTLPACVTSGPTKEFAPSKVVERVGDLTETPDWAKGESVMAEESGDITFSNVISMGGDSRPDACTKAASLGAKVEMLKHIKESITASGQLSDESVQSDPAFESFTAFLSQGEISGAKIAERYWERREESSADGDRVLRLRCAVKLTIPKPALAKMLREATTKTKKGNPEIREKLFDVQESYIESVGKQDH